MQDKMQSHTHAWILNLLMKIVLKLNKKSQGLHFQGGMNVN